MSKLNIEACEVEVRDSLEEIDPASWNALRNDGNPFLLYEFFRALESTGCLGEKNGWYPRYFLVYLDQKLIAACPTFVKTNSYGEFVFDWSWADAYERNQLDYYPKMVSSIPYTPCTGKRFLVAEGVDEQTLILTLEKTIINFCAQQKYSSMHWLFVTKTESELLSDAGLLTRKDCQYHWQNRDYDSMDAFLAECTAKRRKTIKRERRHVTDAEITLERRLGDTLSDEEWAFVHSCYCSTFEQKWGSPSLTKAFFQQVGRTMGDKVLIVFAYREPGSPMACSIMFIGKTTLYGRFWGCTEEHHSLHFEACYYQGIEFAIENKLQTFEPGAQGEHKITRGFQPTLTYSSHWIAHPQFSEAIERFLTEETKHVHQRCEGLSNLLPFKHDIDL